MIQDQVPLNVSAQLRTPPHNEGFRPGYYWKAKNKCMTSWGNYIIENNDFYFLKY